MTEDPESMPELDPTLSRGYLVFSVLLLVACVAGSAVALYGPVPYMAVMPAGVAVVYVWQIFRNVRARRP